MYCERCAGLLIHEDIQEFSGRFLGWRCIQCGFRLDETIAQNRLEGRPLDPSDGEDVGNLEDDESISEVHVKPAGRRRRSARSA